MRALVRQGLGFLAGVALALLAMAGCNGEDPEGSGGNTATGGPTWCEVRAVLQARCWRCHVGEGVNGAPFPLETYEDTQVQDAPGPRWQRMQAMVEDDKMPPSDAVLSPPAQPVTASEKGLLLAWFEAGAEPVGGTDCPD
ncbi:MAG TPA: hypothetical protein VJN18_15140 [Polyangiaceae bacterium]|nr:hypothetical protein [Polyangiaceae bacterium]